MKQKECTMYGISLTLKRLISIVIESGWWSLSQSSAQCSCAKKKSVLWALQSHVMTALELQEPEHVHFLLILLMAMCTSLMILWKPDCFNWKQKWKKKTTKWITILVPMQAVIKPINSRWVWGRCLMKQKGAASEARR